MEGVVVIYKANVEQGTKKCVSKEEEVIRG
jgi:hypothetical protein